MKTLFAIMLAAMAANAESLEEAESLQQADLAKLRDPSLREAEVSRLADCDKNYSLTRYYFLTANQKDGGPPLHVLCAERHYESSIGSSIYGSYSLERPEELFGKTATTSGVHLEPDLELIQDSVILIFDSSGKEVRPFGGNNYTNEGYFFDFDHDGIIDRADSTNYAVEEAEKDSVAVFKLQSVEAKPRTLLEVIYNWHPRAAADANDWNFSCEDGDGDGFPEITFRPEHDAADQKPQKFVFRWDRETKSYSAGDIPPHSHVRVMKPGEELSSIAKAGALGYPLIKDPDDTSSDEPPAPSPQAPYVFRSLKDQPASELAAFFTGKKRRDSFDGPKDSFTNRLPENFFNLAPKQAALALAEANRTPTHRSHWKLALDDRDHLTPPASGWLLHHWGSSGCYSYSSNLFALRFGVPDPSLIVFDYNSIGVVGRNPWADQPANGARVIKLTEKEARFLADTVFWLDRVRSYQPRKSGDNTGHRSSTADGSGTITLYPDGAAPRELASQTMWATSSISGLWDDEYTQEVFVNLAGYLISDRFPALLGERWKIAPEIDRQFLGTTAEERLAPRVDDEARQKLSDTFASIIRQNAKDPVPAAVIERLVDAAGDEALTELQADLEKMLSDLPPANAEDQEFADLEKRFATDHFGEPLADKPAEEKKAYERLSHLREKREFVPAAILRDPLTSAIARLRLTRSAAALKEAVKGNGPDSRWALGQFHRLDQEAWASLVSENFKNGELDARRTILDTLSAGAPAAADKLIAGLSAEERHNLSIEIADHHQKNDPSSTAGDVPLLMSLVRDKKVDYIRRGQAMSLLSKLQLPPAVLSELTTLLVAEIQHPQAGQYGSDTLDQAITALAALPGAVDHLEVITSKKSPAARAYGAGFNAILKIAKERPDRDDMLVEFIRPQFVKSSGMMNDIFLNVLSCDLRGLAPELAAFASEGPSVQDGDGANYSGGRFKTPVGQRYHIAREITALWSESDPVTLGRMWIYFVAAHPGEFNPERGGKMLAELASTRIRLLPAAQRRDEISSAITLMRIPEYYSGTQDWLTGLGRDE